MRDLVKIKEKEEEEEMSEMVDIVEKFPKTIFEKFSISNKNHHDYQTYFNRLADFILLS